ncbi:extensin-like domain-containing protein [Terrihabitans sp. B22-R8]|uniref:extensin-like domain-containing protein n=1 Tax=Terrihabitans sp. B22-R8 TaxID=3425128 RepID=UPI00403C154B
MKNVPLPTPRPAELSPKKEETAEVPVPEPKPEAETAKEKPPLHAEAPPEQKTMAEPPTADPKAPAPPKPAEETAALSDPECEALKAGGEVEFKPLPAITEGQCGAPFPISLIALTPKGGERVELEQPVVMRCAVAAATLKWVKESVQPAAQKHLGETLKAFQSTNGYACRGRNRVKGAKLSEHARANAIDIGAFQTKSGKSIPVGATTEPGLTFMLDIRAKACGPFTTVLGPGSDTYHATHFHLDTIKRGKKGNTTYCH